MEQIVNLMEEVVLETIDGELAKRTTICKCHKCRCDIYALALNNLKPSYAVNPRGKALFNVHKTSQQGRADIMTAVIRAINQVASNVQHEA